jgi:hypothetical protein
MIAGMIEILVVLRLSQYWVIVACHFLFSLSRFKEKNAGAKFKLNVKMLPSFKYAVLWLSVLGLVGR